MTCDALNGLLDALMDDALTDEQRRAMVAHAATCPDCAAAMRSALQLKALFDEMEPEVDVPLAAQAKWRGAVREESARLRRRKLIRWIGSAAAAVVVLAGVGLVFNMRGTPKRANDAALVAGELAVEEAAPKALERSVADAGALPSAVVETDGVTGDFAVEEAMYESEMMAEDADEAFEADEIAEVAAAGAAVKQAPACALTIRVNDVDTACGRVRDLVEEYDGAADAQPLEGGGANLYITIDAGDAGDFLNAVLPMDESGTAISAPELSGEGSVLLLLTVRPK